MSCRCVLAPEEQLESEIVYGPQQEIVVPPKPKPRDDNGESRVQNPEAPRSELPSRVMTFRT